MFTLIILSAGKGTAKEMAQMILIALFLDACVIVPNVF